MEPKSEVARTLEAMAAAMPPRKWDGKYKVTPPTCDCRHDNGPLIFAVILGALLGHHHGG